MAKSGRVRSGRVRKPRVSKANPEPLKDQIARMDDATLFCRDPGIAHSWVGYDVVHLQGALLDEILRCSVCNTKKTRTLNRHTGMVVDRPRYSDRPANYLIKGLGYLDRMDQGEMRRARLIRSGVLTKDGDPA